MDILLWEQIPEDAKEAPQGLKPEEEIARFSVDEHLNEVERTNIFLTGGHAVQQRKAIDSLPALLKYKGRAGWEAVQSNLLQLLPKLDVEFQVATAEALTAAVQQRVLPSADVSECLLQLAIGSATSKDKSEEESEAWLQLLLEMLPVLPSQQLLDVVLPLALAKGQVNESVGSRVSACRLLGGMAPHLVPADVSARFAAQLLAACQDTDYQVRIAAAQQLPVLARVMGPAATVSQLLPELKELLEDDEVQVRVSGLSGLVSLCGMLPREAQVAQLLPLVRRHMQPLELALPLQRTLAAAFPQLLAAVHDDLEPSDAGLLYGCFRHLAARSDAELRRLCASRLPALMAAPLPGSSGSYLHDTWTDLALDHDMQVRAAIAAQFHVVAGTVAAADAARLLRRPLVALLRDGCPAVREALLPGLGATLQVLCGADERHKEGIASDVHQALLVLMGAITHNWRAQQHLAAALPTLPSLLGVEPLVETWAPYAFDLLLSGAACVKPTAATGLAHLLRGCRRERPRTELYCRVMRELAWGKSCWARLAYIQLVSAALPLFSCRWVKEHLLEGLMGLLSDGVPNVRLAALGLLPALKQTIRLPEDVERLEQLNSAMSNLMTDNDRDVSHAARSVHDTFKRTPLRMTGGAGLLDMNGSTSGAAEFETADHAKEEFEAELTLTQEELEKLRIELCSSNPDRRGRRTGAGLSMDSSGSGGHSVPTLRKNNSRGRIDASRTGVDYGSSSSSSNSSGGAGGLRGSGGGGNMGAAADGLSGSRGGAGSGLSWSADSRLGVQRFGGSGGLVGSSSSSTSTSSSTTAAGLGSSGLILRTSPGSAATATARPTVGRASVGGSFQVPSSSTGSSSYGISSPRHPSGYSQSSANNAAAAGGAASSKAAGGAAGFGGSGGLVGPGSSQSPLQSPTGSNLLGNLRLPVLAGSPKAPAGSGSNTSSSSSSPSSFLGASRLGQAVPASSPAGALGSSGLGSSMAASVGLRPGMAGSLAAAAGTGATGIFGKANSSSSSSSSSRGAAGGGSGSTSPTKASAGAFGSSSSSSTSTAAAGSKHVVGGIGSRLLSGGTQGTTNSSAAAKRFR